jgi:thymidylate kinase
MATRRLILIEGMIGAGKSTTAAKLAGRLTREGEDARVYLEFADDHPIRTRAVDLLRAAYPDMATLPDVGADGLALDAEVYGLEQWARLASRCSRAGQTVILESAFLQNSVMPSFLDGAPVDEVKAKCASIEDLIAPADPLLIYLRPSDIDQALRRVHGERGAAWAAQNIAYVANCPWARRRGLTGREAIIELYRAWESVVDELLATSAYATLLVVDPQHDWEAALERICSAVGSRGSGEQGAKK